MFRHAEVDGIPTLIAPASGPMVALCFSGVMTFGTVVSTNGDLRGAT